MAFHSLEFLIFAPLALLGHALLRGRSQRIWLIIMSYLFYGWGNPLYCLLLLMSTTTAFLAAQRIDASDQAQTRKAWLTVSIVINLGLLAAFRYLPFLTRGFNRLSAAMGFGLQLPLPEYILPIGISFYTFQTLSYTIDVYRKQVAATRSFTTMALFVAFFPQLIAGPIERAPHLMRQIEMKPEGSADDLLAGASRILWGLTKKLVFADWLAAYVNWVFVMPEHVTSWELLLAIYAFAFQIYLDFSGCTDIAIGLSRMMGIYLRENFRWPYLARNISEFWKRWHISFTTWLQDYLYLPLGGSRLKPARAAIGILTMVALAGLWHGGANTLILWGLWIGLGMLGFHTYAAMVPADRREYRTLNWTDVVPIALTFHWLAVSWVFFRSGSVSQAVGILQRLTVSWHSGPLAIPSEVVIRTAILVAIAGIAHILRRGQFRFLQWERLRSPTAIGALWGILILFIALLFAPQQQSFAYLRF